MEFKYCPKCSHNLKQKDIHGHTRLVCNKCGFIFYNNPKPTAGVFIVKNNKVLLAKRAVEPFKGWWDSIGGFMESGETPQEAAIRETKEETGLDIKLINILNVGKDRYEDEHTVPIVFLAKIIGGKPKPADDVDEIKWFSLSDLPGNIAFESDKRTLKLIKEGVTIN